MKLLKENIRLLLLECAIGGKRMKTPLVIIAGPTAVGKTALSIGLAKKLD